MASAYCDREVLAALQIYFCEVLDRVRARTPERGARNMVLPVMTDAF